MLEKGKLITLSDNKKYAVVDYFRMDSHQIIYLIDINNPSNILYGTIENDEIHEINNPELLEKVVKTISERIQKN